MNKKVLFAVAIIIVLFAFMFIKTSTVIGVTANNIEQDARKSQKINNTWNVSKSVDKNIGAMIFYDDNIEDYVFSIYLKHDGFSFGYFFASGGSTSDIMDGVREFTFEGKGSVLISMNKKEISKIELNNGNDLTIINIDSTKPFAQVISSNSGEVTLFDEDGNEVTVD
jgi:hypothetical protein